MGKLSDVLGSTVYLDSNIIIYAVEGLPEYAVPIQALLEAMDSGEISGVTSDLTLAECSSIRSKIETSRSRRPIGGFSTLPTCFLRCPFSRQILEDAAEIRASSKLKLPDAIHLATAVGSHCESFLTNDQAFKSVQLISVHLVSDVVLP
jgi:predicted nucleic acid-binding protein